MTVVSFPTDFTVYDGRHHVLGASMLAAMFDGFRGVAGLPADGVLKIKRAKFVSKTGSNGTIFLSADAETPPQDDTVAATLVGSFDSQAVTGWFIPDAERAVVRDMPSANRMTDLVPEDDFGGQCLIEADGIEPLLRCAVDANKHLQLRGHGVAERFGSDTPVTELVYWEGGEISSESVPFKGRLLARNLAMRFDQGRLFTLNGISLLPEGRAAPMEFRMALSFHERA